MSFTAQDVKKLRDATGIGMMDAQKALTEANGDFDQAMDILRKSSAKFAAKKGDREVKDGLVVSYIHPGSKVGVIVEVNCETDFVALTDDFSNFCHDVAMHIAATAPLYLEASVIPAEVLEKEKEVYLAQLSSDPKDMNKPQEIKEKILQGKIDKYINDNCLLNQPFIKDDSKTIGEYLQQTIAKTGENIKIRNFARLSIV